MLRLGYGNNNNSLCLLAEHIFMISFCRLREKWGDFANYFHPAHMYVVDIPSGVGDLIRAYTLASSLHFINITIWIWMQMAKGRHLVAISLDRFECGRDNDISPFRISLFLEICDFTQNQKVASFQLLKWQQELQNGTNP